MRILGLVFSAFMLFYVNSGFADKLSEQPKRPNILFLLAEDMSSHVGAFGDSVAVTPTLDRLAMEGIRYTNTFTTSPVCGPSRAAFITGVHQITTGTQHMRTSNLGYLAVPPKEVKAFPELLRKAGYYTYTDHKNDYQFSKVLTKTGPFTIWDDEGRSAHWRNRPNNTPFFAMINFSVTHESGIFPHHIFPRFWKEQGTLAYVLQLINQYNRWGLEDVVSPEDVVVPPYYPDTMIVRSDIARMYNNVNCMDGQVAAILKELEEDGLADSTIVIWTTDHGDGLPRAKRDLYDSGIKVPMIIRWPEAFRPKGVKPGDVDKRLISFIDLAPTILSLAGIDIPDFIQGQVAFGPKAGTTRTYVYAQRDRIDNDDIDRRRAVRDARFKYIRNYHPERAAASKSPFSMHQLIQQELHMMNEKGLLKGPQTIWFQKPRPFEELFDTQHDPHEIANLSDDPVFQDILLRMREELDRWLEQTTDLGAIPEADMIEKMWPGGKQPVTMLPDISIDSASKQATLSCSTEGSSMGYQINDSAWQVYAGPFPVKAGDMITAKAIRYGYKESGEVEMAVKKRR